MPRKIRVVMLNRRTNEKIHGGMVKMFLRDNAIRVALTPNFIVMPVQKIYRAICTKDREFAYWQLWIWREVMGLSHIKSKYRCALRQPGPPSRFRFRMSQPQQQQARPEPPRARAPGIRLFDNAQAVANPHLPNFDNMIRDAMLQGNGVIQWGAAAADNDIAHIVPLEAPQMGQFNVNVANAQPPMGINANEAQRQIIRQEIQMQEAALEHRRRIREMERDFQGLLDEPNGQ